MNIFTNAYDEYGVQKTASIGRFQYTGQTWLSEIGLYYYKARFYSPVLGRFLQTDPIGYKDNYNLYAYVGNDPLNRRDPSGLCAEDLCIVEGGAAIGTALVYTGVTIGIAAGLCDVGCAKVKAGIENFVHDIFHKSEEAKPSDRPAGPDGKTGSTGGPGAGKKFPQESPEVKADKEGAPCRYCGTSTTNEQGQPNSRERDHIDPKSRDGNNSPDNEGDSCRTCNRSKGARNPDEWQPPAREERR